MRGIWVEGPCGLCHTYKRFLPCILPVPQHLWAQAMCAKHVQGRSGALRRRIFWHSEVLGCREARQGISGCVDWMEVSFRSCVPAATPVLAQESESLMHCRAVGPGLRDARGQEGVLTVPGDLMQRNGGIGTVSATWAENMPHGAHSPACAWRCVVPLNQCS